MDRLSGPPALRRRQVVGLGAYALAAAAWVPRRAGAATEEWRLYLDKLIAGRTAEVGRIAIDLPEVAENGATVPITVSVESPMQGDDRVTTLSLVSERNPNPELGTYHFTARSGRAVVSSRIRLAESQRIHAVAETADGRVLTASREVEVVIGGCGA
jgi:sulfur-oxidizing protein SoxY